jgi:tetratricopeptide (TPR) repeat protein
MLANTYQISGKYSKAQTIYEKTLRMSNRHPWALGFLCIMYVNWGKKTKAQNTFNELIEKSEKGYVQSSVLAMTAAALGNDEEAITYASKACEEHDHFLFITAKHFPITRALRQIDGFDKILKKMGWKL